MALGFAAIALMAVLAGDSTIAALAGFIALVTVALAVAAPWLSKWMNPPEDTK
jgi:membrane protein implicated in regulation of membrane protease activity